MGAAKQPALPTGRPCDKTVLTQHCLEPNVRDSPYVKKANKETNNNTKKNNLPDKGEREKEEAGLKFNILKTKFMASGPITSWQIDGETMETATNFMFLVSKITADGDCSHEIK